MEYDETNQEELLILDSSLNDRPGLEPLPEILYSGERAIKTLENIDLTQYNMVLEEIQAVIRTNGVGVITEVVNEMENLLNILNHQTVFINNSIREKRRNRRSSEEDNTHITRFLREYTDSLHRTIKLMANKDPRVKFMAYQNEVYNIAYEIAQYRSEDLSELSLQKKLKANKNPRLVGNSLSTDSKLVACSFAVAYEKPVTILTRDQGIEKLVARMSEQFPINERKGIKVFNPDYDGSISALIKEQVSAN